LDALGKKTARARFAAVTQRASIVNRRSSNRQCHLLAAGTTHTSAGMPSITSEREIDWVCITNSKSSQRGLFFLLKKLALLFFFSFSLFLVFIPISLFFFLFLMGPSVGIEERRRIRMLGI